MKKKILKALSKLCFAFVSIYGLNLILSGINVFIPINIITIILVTFLGSPGILGLVAVYLLI
ncbi:MAG TPA: pro-sigmaK processing inhibitor BofA family protein [Candidatus Caccenecus avistercoris]|nr:pro-sigmaK processing inhibitor BofA family protein [Candidatus Caccenecus avistercoris]